MYRQINYNQSVFYTRATNRFVHINLFQLNNIIQMILFITN